MSRRSSKNVCYINNSSFSIDNYITGNESYDPHDNISNYNDNTIAITSYPLNHDENGQRLYQPNINYNITLNRKGKVEDELIQYKKRYDEKCIRKQLNITNKLNEKKEINNQT